MAVLSHGRRTEYGSSSVTTSIPPADLIVPGQPLFGMHRLMKDDDDDLNESCRQLSLYRYKYMFYENVATFHEETKATNVFNLHGSFTGAYADSDPNGHAHNISGELFKLCRRGEQYGVWKRTCSGTWDMVCECPYFEEMWSCLRVLDDWLVLTFKFPRQIQMNMMMGLSATVLVLL